MHTITDCPRCKKDFMYHQTDAFLDRTMTIVDEVGNNEVIDVVICQTCHDVEQYINNISKQYDLENYETYKQDVHYFWEQGALNELEADGLITVDKEERREDGSLSSQSFRLLTEEEFNGRFKIFEQTNYPIQDNIWASRRWNKDRTEYIDLSGTDQEFNWSETNEEELPF